MTPEPENTFTVTPLTPACQSEWRPLFDGYGEFYKTPVREEVAATVWSWLMDPGHVMEGLIARDSDGRAVGMAHIRACPRSLAGGYVGFLDDMFVTPEARGSGAAAAIFSALEQMAADRQWGAIRWITQHFNERGRGFYDKYTGGPSDFLMYQWKQD